MTDDGSPVPPPPEWEPAASKPGEVFTPEGQIAAAGAFGRGLTNKDPRLAPYRRSMMSMVLICLAACAVVILIAVLATIIL
jgi:hypothetical protein